MLSQLMRNNTQLTQFLYDHVTKSSEVMLSSESAARSLLQTAFKSCDKNQKVYIILDGLDECSRDERKMITTWFKKQVHDVPSTDLGLVRCLFVSQDDGYARKDLSDCASIKLTTEDTQQDIESFCTMWQTQIAEKFKPFDLQAHDIATIIASRSQGNYPMPLMTSEVLTFQGCFCTPSSLHGICITNQIDKVCTMSYTRTCCHQI
jgi:hypothetical protein